MGGKKWEKQQGKSEEGKRNGKRKKGEKGTGVISRETIKGRNWTSPYCECA
jgi:hypothetical protein